MSIAANGLKIGIRSHPGNEGKEYTVARNYGTDWKRGTHVEMVESSVDTETALLFDNLKGDSFTPHYGAKVRLTLVL